MTDFLRYVLEETKSNRLSKRDAIDLILQFQGRQRAAASVSHPLLHRNTSDLGEQRFTSTFTGDEFFLHDHIVQGQRILPGVAYLEMARVAVSQAAPQDAGTAIAMRLEDIAWIRPFAVGAAPADLHIALIPADTGSVRFETYSGDAGNEQVHASGRAVFFQPGDMPRLDIASLKERCTETVAGDACHAAFKSLGLDFGPAFRALVAVHAGTDEQGRPMAVGEVRMPVGAAEARDACLLHPSLLDACLQTAIGLGLEEMRSGGGKLKLPFSLQSAEILAPLPDEIVAVVRYSEGSNAAAAVQKIDIDVVDPEGRVCVRLSGFTMRVLDRLPSRLPQEDATGTLLLRPEWKQEDLLAEDVPSHDAHLVVLCGVAEGTESALQAVFPAARCIRLASPQAKTSQRYADHAAQLLAEVQGLLAATPANALIQLAVPADGEGALHGGLGGLLKSAQLENPRCTVQVVALDAGLAADAVARCLQAEAGATAREVRYANGRREVLRLQDVQTGQGSAMPAAPWKDGGVYLITGGAGGLGLMLAREIAGSARNTVLVLTGRTVETAERRADFDAIEANGAIVDYRSLDISDGEAVNALVADIVAYYGALNGVIHCAGVLQDSLLGNKTEAGLRAVLAPKVAGLAALDDATRDIALDHFVLFSSVAGLKGNPGQADYAAANAFMDAYSVYRSRLVAERKRSGVTVSINWPLWAEGGMQLDAGARERLRRATGMVPLESEAGMQALRQAMSLGFPQVGVLAGEIARLRASIAGTAPAKRKIVQAPALATQAELQAKVEDMLVSRVSELLKIRREDIDADAELNEFGFDSITLTNFNDVLAHEYGLALPLTAFFEFPTLRSLAEHLAGEHRELMARHFAPPRASASGAESGIEVGEDDRPSEPVLPVSGPSARRSGKRFLASAETAAPVENTPEPIAIIGMSGCFPQAEDLKAFWENLRTGRDCIGEIPDSRWDWSRFYGDPAREPSKTNVRHAGIMEGVDRFDPLFFGISPGEAEAMDPQQRLLMTYVWKVIEDAGYAPQSISGSRTAVFAGTISSGYSARFGQAGGEIEGYSAPGATPSVGPNRMSFLLNLHGPSEPVETACSSALVAIHRAVMSIQAGECEMAIAGGVNAIVSPEVQVSFSKAGMLCEDGRCKTFSAQANGYVRGEGVGMLMLKKLGAAERDGDHIYGLIRGSAENHGGRASSLTAPNPRSQAEVIKAAVRRAGVDPRTIGYVEAHGSGTPLGDPIEIQGLKSAFRELNEGRGALPAQYCGVGSVKTNVGHLELAAGVAGVIKVLLQMRHRTLVRSLHCEEINPQIDLEGSPFYIMQQARPWEPVRDADGRALPLRAGVSSFGFGGVNAHVVLEEYRPALQSPSVRRTGQPVVAVLSARNEDRLKDQVRQLLRTLGDYGDEDLDDIAYTLQVGRDAMEARLACVVTDIEELKDKLGRYLEGKSGIPELYRGDVKRNKDALGVFAADQELQEAIEKWIARGKLSKLSDLWVKGLAFDWNRLHGQGKRRRLSLPTYPFAQERYWIPAQARPVTAVAAGGAAAALHPLLHANTSDLSEQRFTSTFTGEEFFLKEHVVLGQRVLPGAAQLELAREAARRAWGDAVGGNTDICLEGVVFARPVVAGEAPLELHVALEPQDDGSLAYEIYSGKGDDAVVHGQGRALHDGGRALGRVDLHALKARCERQMDEAACYEAFAGIGLQYGPAFRGMRQLGAGLDASGEAFALAEIDLPRSVAATKEAYVLHPALVDAALQSTLGLMIGKEPQGRLALPFAVERVLAQAALPAKVWAVARQVRGEGADAQVRKFDIDIVDESGTVCASLQGFSTRTLQEPLQQARTGTILMSPQWLSQDAPQAAVAGSRASHSVLLCEVCEDEAEIAAALPAARVLRMNEPAAALQDRYTRYATQLLEHIQEIFRSGSKENMLVQLLLPAEGEGAVLRGLGGLLKSARQENPRLVAQVIGVPQGLAAASLAEILEANIEAGAVELRYEGGRRYCRQLQETAPRGMGMDFWKEGGVYLVTGGLGGLGLIFAKHIAGHAKQATLVLTGRRPLDDGMQAPLDVLRSLGAQAEYRAVDVADAAAVQELIAHVQARYGRLDGVLHAAGIHKDSLVVNKGGQVLAEVLAPKVTGLVNLDIATREMALDVFILFGSTAGVLGNAGQADYAAANAFMDAYADWRNTLVEKGQRKGRTLSVDWPLWAEGGMQVDTATRERMWRAAGMLPLETDAGISALRQAVALDAAQVAVFSGDVGRIARLVQGQEQSAARSRGETAVAEAAGNAEQPELKDRIEAAMMDSISGILKISRSDLDPDAELSEFGFDSITLTAFGNELNSKYGLELTPTIFFEYPTIASLAAWLAREHAAVLGRHFTGTTQAVQASRPEPAAPDAADLIPARRRRSRFSQASATPVAVRTSLRDSSTEPIAIIGMSGCFPEAADIDALWQNLLAGRDCIGEIPATRWNWDILYGDPHKEANKTNIKRAGLIDGVDRFDPLFFGISPREAEVMDPQQRLLMMHVWKVIEDAGYSPHSLSGSNTGLFIGTGASGYNTLLSMAGETIEGYSAPGMVPSVGPNRMSYLLNLHGPSEPIETACSSALVAVHRALLSMQAGQCEMAIVGGVNTLISPEPHISFSKAGMLSQDGKCKTFSAQANGYVRGEGVGMLMLKKLSAAERDGDTIHAVIRGSAENHGGRANSLTAPNPRAQADLIKTALTQAGIEPGSIGYIEAHGTGTPLGDPIEVQGLHLAFRELAQESGHTLGTAQCGIGSIKTNIGHLELAAGVAGLIKAVLQMRHKTLVKSLHSDEINPYIQLQDSPFYVVQENRPWEAPKDQQGRTQPRRAGVSSFGFGGVNAHVVLEEYVPKTSRERKTVTPQHPAVIVLSAKTEERLQAQAKQLLQALERHADADLADIAYTLQVGREGMEVRLACIVPDLAALKEKLGRYLVGETGIDGLYRGEVKRNKEALAVFAADDDLQRAIDAWLARGKLSRLAELWCKGLAFDWNKLYGQGKPQRISLPTYPFAEERYWVSGSVAVRSPSPSTSRPESVINPAPNIDLDFFARLLNETDSDTLDVGEAAVMARKALF